VYWLSFIILRDIDNFDCFRINHPGMRFFSKVEDFVSGWVVSISR
jgi:hypothetical protein